MVFTTIPVIDENLQLHHVPLSKDQTNTAIVARMRDLSVEPLSIKYYLAKKVVDALLMRKPAVGKGLVLKTSDPEAQSIATKHLFKIKEDDTLTKLLFGTVPVLENGSLHAYLVNGVQDNHAGYTEVWCFYHAVSGHAASIWLSVALGIAVALGLAVGVGVGDGQLGLEIGTGLLAVLTGVHLAIVLGMIYR